MSLNVSIHRPDKHGAQTLPVLIDSPHSGRVYPPDFSYICTLPQLRASEDYCVDELLVTLPRCGATVVVTHVPRTYIDTNRALTDLDTSLLYESWPWLARPTPYSHAGIGLIHRDVRAGQPIYRERLTVSTLQHRIRSVYMPYHEAVARERAVLSGAFGGLYMLNMHSMPAHSAPKDMRGRAYDVVLGDRDGTSAALEITLHVADIFQRAGLTVGINKNFKGGEIVRRYGEPAKNVHAIQVEFNRALYMDEGQMALREQDVEALRGILEQAVLILGGAATMPQQQAAE